MGSCLSTNKFQGEGRTLNEPSPAQATNPAPPNTGRRLGGAPPSAAIAAPNNATLTTTSRTTDADREARAKAAERRMSQQASKGTPTPGKLSKQLEQQKRTNPHSLAADADKDGPHRVVWD